MRSALILAVAAAACAQPHRDPAEVLARARDKLLDRADRIPNYICVETVNRSYLKDADARSWPASCDQIMGAKKKGKYRLRVEATDRLRLDVKISDGEEIGAWAGAHRFDSRSIMEFAGGGPFGTGPLGTLIEDIFLSRATDFQFHREEVLNRTALFKFSYHVALEFSHYRVKALNGWVPTSYSGELWIEPESFELRRLTAGSSELPPETLACVADMDVIYERERIGARDFLLPHRSELHFVMRDSTETHSVTTYSDCREYHAESTVRFDESPPMEPVGKGSTVVAAPALPAGLRVRLALETPIDTDIASAGDVFTAKVLKAVRGEHSKETIIPPGAAVRGRIVGLQHFFGSWPYFQIAMRPQSIDIAGVELAFYAMRDRNAEFEARELAGLSGHRLPIWLPPAGQPPNVGAFFFPTWKGRFIVPRGQESDWITITTK